MRFWLLLLAMVCLCGCETVQNLFGGGDQKVDSSVVATWWDGPRIRPGVNLIVQVGVASAAATVMNVEVDQNGEITLPYLLQQPVVCDGLTLDALKQKLTKAYQEFLRQPMITVTFGPFDARGGVSPWGTVTVLGEVSRPGPVNMPSTMDMTVTKVLQEAGGCKPFANKSAILVTRCEKDGSQTRTKVDIEEIGKGGGRLEVFPRHHVRDVEISLMPYGCQHRKGT